MSYVLWNGSFYINTSETGRIIKTKDRNAAKVYSTVDEAKKQMRNAPSRTKNYFIRDKETNEKISDGKKIKRKHYSDDVKKLLYINAGGRCEICGKKISLKEISLDHRIPLSKGGEDDVSNLACTCDTCNKMKGCILPDDMLDKMLEIITYQIEQKHKLKWKITHRLLLSCIK